MLYSKNVEGIITVKKKRRERERICSPNFLKYPYKKKEIIMRNSGCYAVVVLVCLLVIIN